MDTQKIVENIQRICKERGTNPTVAGEKSGAGKSLVTQLKTRGIMPSIEKFKMLAEYLGVTTSELLGEVPISSDPGQAVRDALTEQLAKSVRVQLSEEKKPTPADGDGPRAEAHRLVDQIPSDRLAEAVRYIKFITATSDME